MSENYYDIKVRKTLEENINSGEFQIKKSKEYYETANKKFPFKGSRIDFECLNNYAYLNWDGKNCETFINFVDNIINDNQINTSEDVIYLGDGLTDCAYIFPLKYIKNLIAYLLDIPQHHYILHKNMDWCIFISFENYVEFGKTI